MTVRQFKEHIADTVNVQPDLQRIIYRGRILNDTMQLKEYGTSNIIGHQLQSLYSIRPLALLDMHGKVVHLVERPPPGPGGAETSSDHPQVNTTTSNAGGPHGRRRVFLHRGPSGEQAPPRGAAGGAGGGPSLSLSSTLCLNRITVARHMLQCAQNIITHMDNPQVPLDNAPMDLLVQETLDTTVVEVGISAISDVDQVQDIMQAFRGAVNAAFRPNGGGVDESDGAADLNSSTASSSSSASSLSSTFDGVDLVASAIITDPVVDTTAETTTTAPAPAATADPAGEDITGGNAGITPPATTAPLASAEGDEPVAAGNNGSGAGATASGRAGQQQQQTTSPRVLGEVVEEMRNVQRRLEPHMQRYYDILMNEPTYTAEVIKTNTFYRFCFPSYLTYTYVFIFQKPTSIEFK